jgi:hypothetical protein
MPIGFNINKAKDIAHESRRAARAKEFAPLDEIIMKQLPNVSLEDVESNRQLIRTKYENFQNQINSTQSLQELKNIMNNFK